MAIGVFDSGVEGLTVHRALTARLPAADFIYLADQANMPYGTRTGEEIVRLTQAGCLQLFDEGCDLIVLACNTASAIALRYLQQHWLPGLRSALSRPVNVLGIIVPTIEVATGEPWHQIKAAQTAPAESTRTIGIFATTATARSRVYEIEIAKRRSDFTVVTEPCPGLAAMVERGAGTRELSQVVAQHVGAMVGSSGHAPDKIVLGSTHYEVIADVFRGELPRTTEVIQQPRATADALEAYLARHRELSQGSEGIRRFLTTGRAGPQNSLVESFWGQPLSFEAARR